MNGVEFCVLFACIIGTIEIIGFAIKKVRGVQIDKHDKNKFIISVVGIAGILVVLML